MITTLVSPSYLDAFPHTLLRGAGACGFPEIFHPGGTRFRAQRAVTVSYLTTRSRSSRMPKSTSNNGALGASTERDKTTASELLQPDTTEEIREDEGVSDTLEKEEDVTGGERKETGEATNDDSETGENSEDEGEYAGKSPATLLEEGKRFFREKKWLQAAEYFSRAVENKVKELNNADFHPELGTFYLWFGDVLLIKEEQQAELFRFNQQQQPEDPAAGTASASSQQPDTGDSNTSGKAAAAEEGGDAPVGSATGERGGGNAAGKVSDEELAFEILEMARKCLAMKLEDAVARQKEAASEETQMVEQQEKAGGEGTAGKVSKKEQQQQHEGEEHRTTASEKILSSEEEDEQKQENRQKKCDAADEDGVVGTERQNLMAEQEKQKTAEDIRETVMDLSFAHVRLADMQLMNEKYEEAAQDYAAAVQLRERYGLPKQTIVAPLLCLAQATFFSGRKQEALSLFQRTYSLGCRIKEGELAMPEGMTAAALSETLEDLQLQIVDLEKQIEADTAAASAGAVQVAVKKGSQCEARDCIAKTTASFDTPQLTTTATAPVKVFKISPSPLKVGASTSSAEPSAAPTAGEAVHAQAATTSAADPHKHTIDVDFAEAVASESKLKKRRIDLSTLRGTAGQSKEK